MASSEKINYNWFDWVKGWENTNPGWHERIIEVENVDTSVETFQTIVEWIYENLDGCEKHCRWKFRGKLLIFKFRYTRHLIWFNLRW